MVPYGGFWWRVLAYFIDAIVMQVVMSVLGAIMGVGIGLGSVMGGMDQTGANFAIIALTTSISLVLSWLYFAIMESSPTQGTLGKMAVGLVVTDEFGQRIGFGRATGRYFAKILSSLILCIGYIMVAFTERKQGLHDIVARTLVYKTRDPKLVAMDERVFA
ncbi:RDD family protein [Novosphingobium sp. 9]|uniref:RDD family protein n=1 Tax=Novosphingobium sp. 9 TaxID=2025349 RepID=UPI0021B4F888|nr:RDD family protein [Novosphingobium sp. 9]